MTEYMKNLRKVIGHAPILQCGACVIIVNKSGELLLQKRRDNNCWGFHGGSVELDEVVEEAAKRELFEETGLIADSLEFFGVFSGADMHYVYPNGDEVSNVDHAYICRSWSGELNPELSEVGELRFFGLNELPANISPPQVKILNEYINRHPDAVPPKMEIAGFLFRRATCADVDGIRHIDYLHRHELIDKAIRSGTCYVAEEGPRITGFAILDESFFGYAFVELLIVDLEYRRRGVGALLLEYLIRLCKTEKLFTSTNESNTPMRKLLNKAGFIPCGQVDALDDNDLEIFYVIKTR